MNTLETSFLIKSSSFLQVSLFHINPATVFFVLFAAVDRT